MVPSRSTARLLVWAALAGQGAFIASWIVAGALEPHYSGVDQAISELGARTAAHPGVVDAGIVVLGLSFAALGLALPAALPRRRAAVVATTLFVAAGALIVVAGVVRLDCAIGVEPCHGQWRAGALSWHTAVHGGAAFIADLLLAATPFAIAWALWPAPSGAAALGCGVFGLALGVLRPGAGGRGAGGGLRRRAGGGPRRAAPGGPHRRGRDPVRDARPPAGGRAHPAAPARLPRAPLDRRGRVPAVAVLPRPAAGADVRGAPRGDVDLRHGVAHRRHGALPRRPGAAAAEVLRVRQRRARAPHGRRHSRWRRRVDRGGRLPHVAL